MDDDLTGTQNLVMIGQLLDLSKKAARARAAELLEWFDLTEAAGKQAPPTKSKAAAAPGAVEGSTP